MKQKKEADKVLCYVDAPFAYFTTQKLADQWGDDWNDAPYEHNAGSPYEWDDKEGRPQWEITKVAYEAPLRTPSDRVENSSYSVEDINRGQVAWLESESWEKRSVRIFAGCSLSEFADTVRGIGGSVYFKT